MTEGHSTEAHAGPDLKAYLIIFAALSVFTAVSFVVYEIFGQGSMTALWIILGVAVVKAALVAVYFMHLILDWKRVYFLIVPTLILGPMLVIVLLPDIVLAWKNIPAP